MPNESDTFVQYNLKNLSDFRLQIYIILGQVRKMAKMVDKGASSRELELAIMRLQEARHWLGEAKGALGSEFPAELADKEPKQ